MAIKLEVKNLYKIFGEHPQRAFKYIEKGLSKEQILELMGLLTERQRDIVILYFYYGETQWEIAKELGITQPQFLRRL